MVATARTASAQQTGTCKATKQWQLEQVEKDHIKLTGQVEIDCGNESMSADQVEIFQDTNVMIATGNVVFTSGTSRIAADRLEYNTRTRTGTFFNGFGTSTMHESKGPRRPTQTSQFTQSAQYGQDQRPGDRSMFGAEEADIYFYGEKISKVAQEKYRITRGGFTTCVQPTPRWRLTSGTVTLNLKHYAVLTNSLFRVKSVPVLYFPIFYYPINKENRATGFLMPLYGSSTIKGQTLSNGFFWAINRSQDATILYDWFSKTGQGLGAEYRYVAAPGSDGQIRFYNLNEHEAEYDNGAGGVTATPARESYQINGSLSQRISKSFRARGRVDYFSNITVQQTYSQNIYVATNHQRVMNGSVSGVIGTFSLNGSYDRSEYFYGTTQSTLRGGTPRVTFQRADKPLFGSPIYFSMSGEAAHLLAERRTPTATIDQGLSRFDIFPRIRFPFTKWQFLTISTSAAIRETYWTEQRDQKTGLNLQDPINRNYFDLRGADHRPGLQPHLQSPRQRLRREDQALDRAVPQHRAHLAYRRLHEVRAARRHRHHRRPVHAAQLRHREPLLPQAGRRRPIPGTADGLARPELLQRPERGALRQELPDGLRHRAEPPLADCPCWFARRRLTRSRRSSGRSTTRSSRRFGRCRPTAPSTSRTGCTRRPDGASGGSSTGCPGSTTRRGWTTT